MSKVGLMDFGTLIDQVVFIPDPLTLSGISALSVFPEHVNFYQQNNPKYFAVYLPQISTYTDENSDQLMLYMNKDDPAAHLVINYNSQRKEWRGRKYFRTKFAGSAFGTGWDMFFIHLTVLGCDKDEKVTKSNFNMLLAKMSKDKL